MNIELKNYRIELQNHQAVEIYDSFWCKCLYMSSMIPARQEDLRFFSFSHILILPGDSGEGSVLVEVTMDGDVVNLWRLVSGGELVGDFGVRVRGVTGAEREVSFCGLDNCPS